MTIVKCAECNQEVSTTAAACPSCGAPAKVFIGKAKSWKDHFSADRQDIEIKHAKEMKQKAGADLKGCLGAGLLLIALVIVVLIIF